MDDTKINFSKNKRKSFWIKFKDEFGVTFKLYLDVIKHPSLLFKGIFQVFKDILYELPKSLIVKQSQDKKLREQLNESASQALALSEIFTIVGTFVGVAIFHLLGINDYVASVIGGAIGNYFSGVISFIIAYVALTSSHKQYSIKTSLIDSFRIVKDCFPAVMALYISEAPIISGFLALGLSRNLAVGINLIVGMAIFTGIAKYSSLQNIAKH